MWEYEPQIRIVNHDHITTITWLGTHIIVRGSKRNNIRKGTLKLKIQLFVLIKNLEKQLVLIAKGILKFGDSQRKTLGRWVITYIEVGVGDVTWWLAHEAKVNKIVCLALGPLILLGAGGVIAGEVKVAKCGTRLGYYLLKLLISEAVLLLALTLAAGVVPVVVVVPVGGVELLPLGQSVMKWVVSLHSKQPLEDLLLLLQNLCKAQNFLTSRAISSSGMLSYCSSEAAHKVDKANSKADESVVLVGLATWPPTWAPVIKALLEKKASWLGRSFLDNSWDFNLLNIFSVSRVTKSTESSNAVTFMPQTESSRAYNNYLARSLSE
jgi:hypothetical protein